MEGGLNQYLSTVHVSPHARDTGYSKLWKYGQHGTNVTFFWPFTVSVVH